MQLKSFELKRHLDHTRAMLYWIHSEEPFLIQEPLSLIRQKALDSGCDGRKIIHIHADSHESDFIAPLKARSLFYQNPLLEYHFLSPLSAQQQKILGKWPEYLPKTQIPCMVFVYPYRVERMQSQAWFKTLDTLGVTLPLWPLSLEQYPRWLTQQAKTYDITLTQSALSRLTHQTMGSPQTADQVLQKLHWLTLKQPITEVDLRDLLCESSQYNPFDLGLPFLNRDLLLCIKILQQLAKQETPPTLILWAIRQELRLLLALCEIRARGEGMQAIEQHLRSKKLFQNKIHAIQQWLSQISVAKIKAHLAEAFILEIRIKTSQNRRIWDEITLWILKIMGKTVFPNTRILERRG
jgi:DNA polymerase-3 subunit delta